MAIDWHSWFESEPWKKGKRFGLTGLKGSSKAYLLSRWKETRRGPLLVIVPTLRRAEILAEDLRFFQKGGGGQISLFPPWETLPYDEIPPHPEIMRERVNSLFQLASGEEVVIVSSVKALMQKVLSPRDLAGLTFFLSVGEEVDRDRLIHFLQEGGYTTARIVEERGDFCLRGGIVDLYTPSDADPLRLEFDGDRLESIRRFDAETQRSIGQMDSVTLLPAKDSAGSEKPLGTFFDYLKGSDLVFIEDGDEAATEAEAFDRLVREHYEKALLRKSVLPPESLYLSFENLSLSLERLKRVYLQEGPIAPAQCQQVLSLEMEANDDLQREVKSALSMKSAPEEASPYSFLWRKLRDWQDKGTKVFIASHTAGQAGRLRELLSSYKVESHLEETEGFMEVKEDLQEGITLLVGPLSTGFRNPHEGWVLLTEEEIFGGRRRTPERRPRVPQAAGPAFSSFGELREGDFVVHVDYGVGLYQGLKHLSIGGISNDYLLLEYLDSDKLYVPVDRLNLIHRYIGGDGRPPKLEKLGGTSWQRAKKKARAAASEMVKELLELYAARQAFNGFGFSSPDRFYKEFEATFQYEETPDQFKAIEDVMKDMGNPKPMDRLVCGDVGYGKTEVAIRASYRAVMDGKQVAILVPTTVLAQQHLQTFRERFKAYPVVIEVLSRFKSPAEQKEILQRVKEGKVDIVVGTHRLLQKDVVFQDLGLVVIDEEHRFGVSAKEKLKQIRKLVDVITLTATPIPRTLQMAISGIRDLSLIQTPPENRLSIQTSVVRYDDGVIREAVRKEFHRGGQVFFVHPRIQNIYTIASHLKSLIPEASLAVAHGQMRGRDLERVMLQFIARESNLLVCTNIIESGLDIPAANTILINHAERFGLADLYQLRGRVGRGCHQAYAYLLVPSELALSPDAMRRLRAIQELSELGSGFKLAIRDLEIRGAGNLLGPSQSGQITAVGLEFYTQLMEKAVKQLKGEEVVEEITPEIHFRLPAFIPEDYVEDPSERLSLYRRLSLTRSDGEVDAIREELADRFGRLPMEVLHLLEVIKVKIILTRLSVRKFEQTPSQFVLTLDETAQISPQKVVELVGREEGRFRITPDSRLVVEGGPEAKKDPFGTARTLLQALA